MTAPVAACVIVRNGVRTLPRLLGSVRPHVDEVCILDTGSTDGTLELLEQAADEPGAPIRVEQEAWRGDFAWARNRAEAIASSDQVMWFDDDEILEGGAQLRAQLAEHAPDVAYVRRVEIYGETGFTPPRKDPAVSAWWGPRAWRRGLGDWHSPINETPLLPVDSVWLILRPDVVRVLHRPLNAPERHGYEEFVRGLVDREPSRRTLACLAMVCVQNGAFAEAAALYERIIDPDDQLPPELQTGPLANDSEITALFNLGFCRFQLGDRVAAMDAYSRAKRLEARLRSENRLKGLLARLDDDFPIRPDDPVWALQADETLTTPSPVAPAKGGAQTLD